MPAPGSSYKKLRRQLDDLGYYQPLVPEGLPLVEALLHDLLGKRKMSGCFPIYVMEKILYCATLRSLMY